MKKRNKLTWAAFAVSVLCFAGVLSISARHPTPLIGFANRGEYVSSEVGTTEMDHTRAPSATEPAAGETQTGSAPATTEIEPTTTETAPTMEPQPSLNGAAQGPFYAAACVLLLAGLAAGLAFLLLRPLRPPFASPAGSLLAGGAALCLLTQLLHTPVITPWTVLAAGLLFAAAEVSVKALCSWAKARFSPSYSLVRYLAEKAAGHSEKAAAAALYGSLGLASACFGAALAFLCGGVNTGDVGFWHVLLPLCAGLFLLHAALAAADHARALAHLTKQIAAARAGQPPERRDGWFAQSEEALLAIDEAREAAVEKAVRDERFRTELITNVSHDLRTPLTGVLGYAELLKKEDLSPEGAKELENLCRKAGYLRDMIEDLFSLSKVSAGQIRQKKEPLDLIKLTEQTLGLLDDAIQHKGLQLRRHYASESAPAVSDGAMLHRVLENLIGNAVKYSPDGARIHLYISLREENVLLRVVNAANYEMDFDVSEITGRFVRGDQARATQGSGLGLAIAKTYTEALGGALEISVDGDQFSAAVTIPTENRQLSPG